MSIELGRGGVEKEEKVFQELERLDEPFLFPDRVSREGMVVGEATSEGQIEPLKVEVLRIQEDDFRCGSVIMSLSKDLIYLAKK